MLMKKRLLILVVLLMVVGLISGCALNQKVTKKDQLLYMYKVFNAQYQDYLSMAKRTDLTDAQKDVLRKKKPILEELQVLIPLYDAALTSGRVTPNQEQQIYDLLNSLN